MPRQFRLSHACIVSKTAGRIIEIPLLSDRPIILVFRHQGLLRNSDGFTPNGGAEYKGKGGSDFRPICGYISETVIEAYLQGGLPNNNRTFLRYRIFAATTDIIMRFLLKCSEITAENNKQRSF